MATCKDCIHWAVCGRRAKSISLDPMKSGYKCPDFKNKADVAEVKRGKWIKTPYSEKDGDSHCSECSHFDWSDCDYCSYCGARMDGAAE